MNAFPCARRFSFLAIAASLILPATALWAWGPEGHKAIAKVAVEELAKINPAAAAKVKEILGDESVEEAAIWPDDVRPNKNPSHAGRFANTEEGKAFNEAHPDNPGWHYVDLPLDVKSYAQDKRFTEEHDVVQMVRICGEVLEGKSDFMSKKQALRCLFHFVGDMHQPLHVAVGFFTFEQPSLQAKLITDPEAAAKEGVEKDNGANKLLLSKDLNLHRYWDENLVADVAPEVDSLAERLHKDIANIPASKGDWKDWPAQWAMGSVEASRTIYGELLFSKRYPKSGKYWMVYVNFKPGAKEKFVTLAEDRLAMATRHLVDILNAIQWAK